MRVALVNKPGKAPEPTTMSVTSRAPSRPSRASHGRGSGSHVLAHAARQRGPWLIFAVRKKICAS